MTQFSRLFPTSLPYSSPLLFQAAAARAQKRFLEFFTANIRNEHTRRAYAQAVREFWLGGERAGVVSIATGRRGPFLGRAAPI